MEDKIPQELNRLMSEIEASEASAYNAYPKLDLMRKSILDKDVTCKELLDILKKINSILNLSLTLEPTTTVDGLSSVLGKLRYGAEQRLKKKCPNEYKFYISKLREKTLEEMKKLLMQ
jgi:hypothetical protein